MLVNGDRTAAAIASTFLCLFAAMDELYYLLTKIYIISIFVNIS